MLESDFDLARFAELQAWLLYSLCPSTYVEIDRIETRTTVAQGAHHPDHLRLCQRTTCCATERAVYHDAARSAEQEKPRLLRGRKFEMQNQILNLKPPGLVWVPAQNGSHFVQSVQFEVRQSTGHFSSLHVSTCSSENTEKIENGGSCNFKYLAESTSLIRRAEISERKSVAFEVKTNKIL